MKALAALAMMLALALPTVATLAGSARAAAPRPSVLLVVGAPGAPEYADRFRNAATQWQKAARKGEAEVITVGLDPADKGGDRARLQQSLAEAARVTDAPLWLVLIGHGTFDGRAARFNLRGPDVSEKDLASWLAPVRRPLILINTASASAPFLRALAGPGRILVTATRSGNEMNAPRFGSGLADAIADPRADLDRDGGVSLLEAFLHAAKRVEASFTEEGLLATEHALLEDNGDGVGTSAAAYQGLAPKEASAAARVGGGDGAVHDGLRARLVTLIPAPPERALPEPLRRRRDQLELAVLSLREGRAKLPESVYYARLEKLLYEIARLYQRADRETAAADTSNKPASAGTESANASDRPSSAPESRKSAAPAPSPR